MTQYHSTHTHHVCPRCGSAWLDMFAAMDYACANASCHTFASPDWIRIRFGEKVSECVSVYWFTEKEDKCVYFTSVMGRPGTVLPYLPFDLTEEQLAMYLTFT